MRAIRKVSYTLVINLHRYASSGIVATASGAEQIIGFSKNPLSLFYHRRFPHQISRHGSLHEVERNHQLIQHLSDEVPARPRLYPAKQPMPKWHAARLISAWLPLLSGIPKQWPAENWVELIQTVDPRYEILLLGAPGDRTGCEDILRAAARPGLFNLAGQLSLLESAALMAGAAMNIAMIRHPFTWLRQ